jgi:hypothetical protein
VRVRLASNAIERGVHRVRVACNFIFGVFFRLFGTSACVRRDDSSPHRVCQSSPAASRSVPRLLTGRSRQIRPMPHTRARVERRGKATRTSARRVRSRRRRRDVGDQRRARAVADEARRAQGRSDRETGSLLSRVCREGPSRDARCAGGVRRARRAARVPPDARRSRWCGMCGRSPRLGIDRVPPRRRRAGGRARRSRVGPTRRLGRRRGGRGAARGSRRRRSDERRATR